MKTNAISAKRISLILSARLLLVPRSRKEHEAPVATSLATWKSVTGEKRAVTA